MASFVTGLATRLASISPLRTTVTQTAQRLASQSPAKRALYERLASRSPNKTNGGSLLQRLGALSPEITRACSEPPPSVRQAYDYLSRANYCEPQSSAKGSNLSSGVKNTVRLSRGRQREPKCSTVPTKSAVEKNFCAAAYERFVGVSPMRANRLMETLTKEPVGQQARRGAEMDGPRNIVDLNRIEQYGRNREKRAQSTCERMKVDNALHSQLLESFRSIASKKTELLTEPAPQTSNKRGLTNWAALFEEQGNNPSNVKNVSGLTSRPIMDNEINYHPEKRPKYYYESQKSRANSLFCGEAVPKTTQEEAVTIHKRQEYPMTCPPNCGSKHPSGMNNKPVKKEKTMWENPDCCRDDPCADLPVRLDSIFYRPVNWRKRVYQQTWADCERQCVTKVVCRVDKPMLPPIERRARNCLPKVACPQGFRSTDLMDARHRSKKCPKISLNVSCKARLVPSCKIPRYPSKCRKVCAPNPSFSECLRAKSRPFRRTECNCLKPRSMCEMWAAMRMRMNIT